MASPYCNECARVCDCNATVFYLRKHCWIISKVATVFWTILAIILGGLIGVYIIAILGACPNKCDICNKVPATKIIKAQEF